MPEEYCTFGENLFNNCFFLIKCFIFFRKYSKEENNNKKNLLSQNTEITIADISSAFFVSSLKNLFLKTYPKDSVYTGNSESHEFH